MSASADIVVGLGYGDEGKGATVDALVAHTKADRVVRFNGGGQAAHNVIHGAHHTFQNFGSGTLSGVPTIWSHFCTFDPLTTWGERQLLKDFDPVLYVDENALVTTGLHVRANLQREAARGDNRHGTTGTGFGETVAYALTHDAIRVKDLSNVDLVVDHLKVLNKFYIEQGFEMLPESVLYFLAGKMHSVMEDVRVVSSDFVLDQISKGHTVFEGAQGFLLDENFGYNPHTTWSTTTPANARRLARQAGVENVHTIGVTRTYSTRHGQGPMRHEGGLDFEPEECHNSSDSEQGGFRTGLIDADEFAWALEVTGVDSLSVTHMDVFDKFQTDKGEIPVDSFLQVGIESWGPTRGDRNINGYS